MASEDLFTKKFTAWIIRKLVAPIPKKKSNADLQAIRDCVKIAREGGTIGIFPEGNRTYSGQQCYIDPAIVKLVKLLKIPVILYNITGGYGVEPRWASNIRKGKMRGRVKEILEVNQIQKMSNDELYDYIKASLDVVEAPSVGVYHSKKQAETLERVLFRCPKCRSNGTIYSMGKKIHCHHCDLDVTYNEHLEFTGDYEGTVNDWYKEQEEYIKNYQFTSDEQIFSDPNVRLYEVTRGVKKTLIGYGKLEMKVNQIVFSRNESSYAFLIDSISQLTIIGKHKLNFYVGEQTFQIKGEKNLNVLKYMQIFYRIKGESNELFRL